MLVFQIYYTVAMIEVKPSANVKGVGLHRGGLISGMYANTRRNKCMGVVSISPRLVARKYFNTF